MNMRGRHYLTGDLCDIAMSGGRIQSIRAVSGEKTESDQWLAPGLIDIQVNGYLGRSFCSSDLTTDDVIFVAEKLTEAGVTAFCPTVTTASFDTLHASLEAIAQACERSPVARARILAIHLEGPYISPDDGPRGAHPREHVRNPDWDEFSRLQQAAGGRIGMVTLAPELPGALDFVARASQAGVIVALGHHAASREQIHAAVNAGAAISTHLGNGAHSQLPRHPNYIWEQLAHDGLLASLIVDGHHLPPAVVKSFYRAKGQSRLILVSDAMPAAGLPAGRYAFMGLDVEVKEDGAVRLSGTPYLAGSTLKLCDAVDNVMSFAGASFADAITMAASNPARLLGVHGERGVLRVGARADLSVFGVADGRFTLAQTISCGQSCYSI